MTEEKRDEFGQTDRQRRDNESSYARACFNAWWEAYRIVLAKGSPGENAMSCFEAAHKVEGEYRERYAALIESLRDIWKGYQSPT